MAEVRIEVVPKRSISGDLSDEPVTPELFNKRVDEIGTTLADVSTRLQEYLDQSSRTKGNEKSSFGLSEVELKFSFEVEAEAGVIITRASTRATFEATMKWAAADHVTK